MDFNSVFIICTSVQIPKSNSHCKNCSTHKAIALSMLNSTMKIMKQRNKTV